MTPPAPPPGDHITISVGATSTSWDATIDLERAVLIKSSPGEEPSERPIAADDLKRLREEAEQAIAQGDYSVSHQFADGCVLFTLVLGERRATLRYETWGGGDYARVGQIWSYIRR